MNPSIAARPGLILAFVGLFGAVIPCAGAELHEQTGSDQTWKALLLEEAMPRGKTSTKGILGSTIKVNKDLVEADLGTGRSIPKDLRIHTLGNSVVPRADFPKWTRWYQEDGRTQVFRLFKDETNMRNAREAAARIEAFSGIGWKHGDGWHEWEGRYTIIKPIGCAIFQVKAPKSDWSVQLLMKPNGDIVFAPRRKEQVVVLTAMTGKSFDAKLRDDGLNYEVFINGTKVGSGSYPRPEGNNNFRWGMYCGASVPDKDAMLFVSGARFGKAQ